MKWQSNLLACALSLFAATSMAPTVASAFDGTETNQFTVYHIGTCRGLINVSAPNLSYYVELVNSSVLTRTAGGQDWRNGVISTGKDPISAADIQGCLGGTANVNITQDGASGTIGSDNYVGFKFRVDRDIPAYSITANTVYEHKIGTGSLADPTPFSTLDTTSPTANFLNLPTTVIGTAPFTISAVFSEAVFGLLPSEVVITNGTVTGIGGGGVLLSIAIQPSGAGDISIQIPAGAVEDAAGNPNTASPTAVISAGDVTLTKKVISDFALGRNASLMGSQPNLIGIVNGTAKGAFDLSATAGRFNFRAASPANSPLWFRFSGSRTKLDGVSSSYFFGAVGAHKDISNTFSVGALAEIDYTEANNGTSGNGWLVGPYFVAKHGAQALFFEGRLLYGQSSNKVSPTGAYTDTFGTERWLGQLSVRGEIAKENLTLFPNFRASHVSDRQEAYVNNLGATISSQTLSTTELSGGLDFAKPLSNSGRDMTLTGGVSGLYSKSSGGASAAGSDGGRMRVDLGLDYAISEGSDLSVSTYYDGIGIGSFEAYGVELGYALKF